MLKEDTSELKRRYAALSRNEQLKLLKKASQIRKSRVSRTDHSGRQPSVQDLVLEILAAECREVVTAPAEGCGMVCWLGPLTCRVRTGDDEVECLLPKKGRSGDVAVGDQVEFGAYGTDMMVSRVLPRQTVLSRPDPHLPEKELVIAANVDVVGIVAAFVAPALHPRMIDRYMVAVQRGGARPMLLLTKTDLLTAANRAEEEEKIRPYLSLMPVIRCSPEQGDGMEEVRTWLEGKTCAFVGKSGVGKSSLLNALTASRLAATKAVGVKDKGRHTTTSSTLYDLGGGTRIIDTPGVRSFGLADLGAAALQWYFPEFEEFLEGCKFNDCTHDHEPVCGVREAALAGHLSRARYDTYLRILKSL
ncbi:MAG: ribosome small subunit-dependent GTPase A [Armatimonadetes bacterium]|nr:ribosome small subunit-dependent GTPase A [Armatimonadota bacterium]